MNTTRKIETPNRGRAANRDMSVMLMWICNPTTLARYSKPGPKIAIKTEKAVLDARFGEPLDNRKVKKSTIPRKAGFHAGKIRNH